VEGGRFFGLSFFLEDEEDGGVEGPPERLYWKRVLEHLPLCYFLVEKKMW